MTSLPLGPGEHDPVTTPARSVDGAVDSGAVRSLGREANSTPARSLDHGGRSPRARSADHEAGATPARPDHDAVIRTLAGRQHGVVTRAQLMAAGVPTYTIDHRLRRGRLHRLFRGVYRAGPVAARHERPMAAVLGCGESAVLSHRSAAVLWKLLPSATAPVPVDVSVEKGNRHRGSRIARVHRNVALQSDERTRLHAIPITTPERTLLDIASIVGVRALEQSLARALRRELVNSDSLSKLLDRYPRRRGGSTLRALLVGGDDVSRTRSEAEAEFLAMVLKAQLPHPLVNVQVEGNQVDFLWREERLVAEVDGFQFHGSAGAFEEDRRRDAILTAHGYMVVRVTWRQLTEEPLASVARLAQALARRT